MSRGADPARRTGLRPWIPVDGALAAAVLVVTALQCWTLPHAIGQSDEGLFLYEAKQVLAGQVLYRDVFELVMPLSTYLMAALFGIFGANVATARGADAVVQGLIAAAVFGIARRLGVRRSLALAAALLHPAWFQPLWYMASPHWLSTLLTLALLAELLRRPRARPVATGIWVGLIIAVQQQRGAPLALAAAAVLAFDHWTAAGASGSRELLRRLVAFAGGVLLLVVPTLAYAMWKAGALPVFEALVIQPLVYYRAQVHGVPWGAIFVRWAESYSIPSVLVWMPVLIVGQVVRAAVERWRGVARWRQSAISAWMATGCAASILYLPDVVHLAFIAPVFAILLVDQLEGVLGTVPGRWWSPVLGATIAAALVVASLVHMRRVAAASWRAYPVSYDSPFGRVQLANATEAAWRDRIRAALDAVPGRHLFVYPGGAALYLETGATNPTPFQVMSPLYSRPEHFATVVDILERERMPYVVLSLELPGDPLRAYLDRNYEPVSGDNPWMTLRRRTAPPPA